MQLVLRLAIEIWQFHRVHGFDHGIIGSIPTKVPNPPQDLAMFEAFLSGQVATA
jgi:hypothetical protein